MRRPTVKQKPRRSQNLLVAAPVAGWIANRSKAMGQGGLPPGATILENWFPTTTGAKLRRGSRRWATLGAGSEPVLSLFTYTVGSQAQLFGATMSGIWDITTVNNPYGYVIGTQDNDTLAGNDGDYFGEGSTDQLLVYSAVTGGNWITTQFATEGGTFLRMVNGQDVPLVYDGGAFSTTPALTFETGDQSEPQDLNYVWSYKRRLFFIKKDSLDAYYLPVSSLGGELALLPLGAVFTMGGSLMFGASWSLGSSDQGGLSAQCVFVTTEGEVAVYQGSNPDDPADWSLVGVYRIGKPLGRKAHVSAGGDVIIATTVGFLPLSEAVQREYAALAPAAVSNPIEDAWIEAVNRRDSTEWSAVTWPDGQMIIVAPPSPAIRSPQVFPVNANTGAWCKFTGWNVRCMAVFRGMLMFGSDGGAVVRGGIGGDDQGETYTGRYLGLFEDAGNPAARKIAELSRATLLSSVDVSPIVSVEFDYSQSLPPYPDAVIVPGGNQWDNAIWNQSTWDAESGSFIVQNWVSVGGSGARMAPSVQLTSGSSIPLDSELVGVDVTYSVADIVS